MKIRFGLQLDGQHAWQPANQLNVTTTGPLGLLNLLETQLGLLQESPSTAERIVQYLSGLKRCDSSARFYHRSLATDELGTAATLLSWRDAWHLNGWSNSLDLSMGARLRDMQAVEEGISKKLFPCLGERLQAVLDALGNRRVAIAEIELCEPLQSFPQRWQAILRCLPTRYSFNSASSEAETLLGKMQRALTAISRGEPPEKLAWKDDGSVRFVRAETTMLAARWMAELLRDINPAQTLIVAEQGRSALDENLSSANLPRQGFKESSSFRPALQVLPLMLEQMWAPLDIYGLLQFLTHPVCPVPSLARTRIAEKLARYPGIGRSEEWNKTLKRIEQACSEHGRDWGAVRSSIDFWVEHKRYERNSENGAPLVTIIEKVTALADYFRGRLASEQIEQRSAFSAGYSQTLACKLALEGMLAQGTISIRPRQLQKLVMQVTARGSANHLLVSELGSCRSVSHPGAAIEVCEDVVWWQISAASMPKPYPWSKQEIAELEVAGIALPQLSAELNQLAANWLKPILCARKTLTLVLPPLGTEVHPVWQMLETVFADKPPVESLETLLDTKQSLLPMQTISLRALPARQRWWQLPEGTPIPRKGRDSFSSLESFLFNPYQWLLRYPAELKPSGILDVSDSFLLYGNLAHNLIERFYTQPDALAVTDEQFVSWFELNFPDIVATEGSVLLLQGRGADLERFREQLKRAMVQLRKHLALAEVVCVKPEQELSGHFRGGEIFGFADLVVTKSDGTKAIVDLKWAGGQKYPGKLATNSHLQLGIYAEMIRQKTGAWPHLAYFILSQAKLIAPDDRFFGDAKVVRKNKGLEEESTPQLWARFENTWAWRKNQQDCGLFELIIGESDIKDQLTDWPDDGLAPESLNPAYNDFCALAGWEASQ
jgi:hypothetical protein